MSYCLGMFENKTEFDMHLGHYVGLPTCSALRTTSDTYFRTLCRTSSSMDNMLSGALISVVLSSVLTQIPVTSVNNPLNVSTNPEINDTFFKQLYFLLYNNRRKKLVAAQ